MNSAIELHDSTLAAIDIVGGEARIRLEPAYLHRSLGTPLVDDSTGWVQNITLIASHAEIESTPTELPIWIWEGGLEVDGETFENCISLPLQASGAIVFRAVTIKGESLVVRCTRLVSLELGEPVYSEEGR